MERVAVIIPCFNDGATLGAAIASLEDQEPHEIVVVDDGSDDPLTLQELDRLQAQGVVVVRQDNQGVHAARSRALAMSTAPFVLTLDSDDLLLPGAITALADVLEQGDLDLVWGDVVAFGSTRPRRAIKAALLSPWRLWFTCEIGNSGACLYRRTSVEAVGGWTLPGGFEDWDMWMAMAEAGMRGARIDRAVCAYRIHRQGVNATASGQGADERVARLRARHPGLRCPGAPGIPWLIRISWPVIDRLPLPWARRQQLMTLTGLIREPWRISRPWRGSLPG